jgi:hypothetical protein
MTMIYCKPIDYPPPAFNPGNRVRFISPEDFSEGGSHYVDASGKLGAWHWGGECLANGLPG